MTQRFAGRVTLPADAPARVAARVVVEIRDVSLADAPAPVVASQTMQNVAIGPGVSIPFDLEAPAAPPGRSYAYQVHVSVDGRDAIARGDLCTMESIPAKPGETTVPVKLVP